VTATMDTQPNQPKVQHCQLNQSIIIWQTTLIKRDDVTKKREEKYMWKGWWLVASAQQKIHALWPKYHWFPPRNVNYVIFETRWIAAMQLNTLHRKIQHAKIR
jgi:hypothetical protein